MTPLDREGFVRLYLDGRPFGQQAIADLDALLDAARAEERERVYAECAAIARCECAWWGRIRGDEGEKAARQIEMAILAKAAAIRKKGVG